MKSRTNQPICQVIYQSATLFQGLRLVIEFKMGTDVVDFKNIFVVKFGKNKHCLFLTQTVHSKCVPKMDYVLPYIDFSKTNWRKSTKTCRNHDIDPRSNVNFHVHTYVDENKWQILRVKNT
jgi:hypothetical protein